MGDKNTFKTKSGYCHVLADRIELSRDGVVGKASDVVVSDGIQRISFLYAAVAAMLLYFAFNAFRHELQFQAMVFFAVGVFLIFEVISSSNNSTTPVINRKLIERVKFKKGIPWMTRSRFEVFFKNEKGQIKKRLIMLPGSLREGRAEAEKAVNIFTAAKLLK